MSLNHCVTAACLSRDNHLLLAAGSKIEEVRLLQEETTGDFRNSKRREEQNTWEQRHSLPGEMRQCFLGHEQLMDPVVRIIETRNMAVVALTRLVNNEMACIFVYNAFCCLFFLDFSFLKFTFCCQVWLLPSLHIRWPSEA